MIRLLMHWPPGGDHPGWSHPRGPTVPAPNCLTPTLRGYWRSNSTSHRDKLALLPPGGHLEILETIKCATSCCFNCLRDEGRSEDSSRSKYRVYELTFMFKLKVLDCGEAADSSNPQAQFMANAITITAQSVPICDPAADQRVRSAKYLYLWRCAWKTP